MSSGLSLPSASELLDCRYADVSKSRRPAHATLSLELCQDFCQDGCRYGLTQATPPFSRLPAARLHRSKARPLDLEKSPIRARQRHQHTKVGIVFLTEETRDRTL